MAFQSETERDVIFERRWAKIDRLAEGAILVLMLAGLAVCGAVIGIGFIGAALDSPSAFTSGADQ